MSELVEKVAVAIRPTLWDSRDAARAAILAVAEWMNEEFSYQAEMIEIKQGMVAALRQAAGGEG